MLMLQYGIVYQGVSYEKASTSKRSAFYGSCDFTSASLHCNRVPPTVGSELPFLEALYLQVSEFMFIISGSLYILFKVLREFTGATHINILLMQWKFVSLTTEEHIKTRLETTCSYGNRYSEYY